MARGLTIAGFRLGNGLLALGANLRDGITRIAVAAFGVVFASSRQANPIGDLAGVSLGAIRRGDALVFAFRACSVANIRKARLVAAHVLDALPLAIANVLVGKRRALACRLLNVARQVLLLKLALACGAAFAGVPAFVARRARAVGCAADLVHTGDNLDTMFAEAVIVRVAGVTEA